MEAILLLVIFLAISLLWFFLKITYAVTVSDPKFALKAFTSGLVGGFVGYLTEGHIAIKLVVWGVGGFVLYAAYKYVFEGGRHDD